MNKLVYTGPTCYLGQWHFTRGKIYDMYLSEQISSSNLSQIKMKPFFYIISDNDKQFYINNESTKSYFITLDKWRELQINKILTYE
jgi:hypothetical protein